MDTTAHPYYPLGVAIPHFRPNETDLVPMLAGFGSVIFSTVFVVWRATLRPSLKPSEQLAIAWFSLCKRELHPPSHGHMGF